MSQPEEENAATVPAADDLVFQHYRVLRREDGSLWKLGQGGMGTTYKAVDVNLDATVALKVINADLLNRDAFAVKRFIREAKAAARLRHPNTAVVHHLGQDARTYFYAMEFIDGETVDERVKRLGPLPAAGALALTLQAARALAAAHRLSLVHRDIKPQNLMLVDQGEGDGDLLKLIDFGLAKIVAGPGAHVSQSGTPGFSPAYASPEQCEELPADIRSDIYSLGAALWFMLLGAPPFAGKSVFQYLAHHISTPPPIEKLEAAGVPGPVREMIGRMLAKDPVNRPQTPSDLRKEIEACQLALAGSRGTAQAPPAPPPAYSFTLEDLLRKRGRLTWTDVRPLLTPLASIADSLAASGREALALFAARRLLAVFPSYEPPANETPGSRPAPDFLQPAHWFARWPDSQLTLRPASETSQLAPESSGVTRPPSPPQFRDGPQALGALIYELLDGQPPRLPGVDCKPLSALNEEGNETLRRALRANASFNSAAEFASVLADAAQAPVPPPVAPKIPDPAPSPKNGVHRPSPQGGKKPPPLLAIVAVFLAVAGGVWWLSQPGTAPAPVIYPTSVPTAVASPARAAPLPVDIPSTPLPSPVLAPSPSPEPSIAAPAFAQASRSPESATKEAPFVNSLGMKFVPVPGTTVLFSMWDTRVKDFEEFAQETNFGEPEGMNSLGKDGYTWKHPDFQQTAECPVVGVSWEDAEAYCKWLTGKERRLGVIGEEQSYRLPTDKEWSSAVGNSRYPWGDEWPPPAGAGNYAGAEAKTDTWPDDFGTIEGYNDGYPRTSPVASFKANRYGLYDMGGNVWQWCEDWYLKTMNSETLRKKYTGFYDDGGGQKYRVLRGASWLNFAPDLLLSSYRSYDFPDIRFGNYGFRCVLVVESSR